jgi:hypothetical protein
MMTSSLTEGPYSAETVLQELVASHPEVLGSGPDAGRLLLIRREAGVADAAEAAARWSLDHLFLDGEGVPVLVEVKRSTDTRIRREVVGQMLDYAAGAAHWTVEQVQGWLRERCAAEHRDADALLAAHTSDQDGFWQQVATNIGARRLRLVFVADAVPSELRAVIEFLNDQMTKSEVLAVEVKQYVDPHGEQTIVVPTVLGHSEQARAVKNQRAAPLDWDLASVLEAAREVAGTEAAEVMAAGRVGRRSARRPRGVRTRRDAQVGIAPALGGRRSERESLRVLGQRERRDHLSLHGVLGLERPCMQGLSTFKRRRSSGLVVPIRPVG